MAHIQKVQNKWRVAWREGGRGSKVLTTAVVKTKREAQAQLEAIEAKQSTAQPHTRNPIIGWNELLERYNSDRSHTTEQHRNNLRGTITRLVARCPAWHSPASVSVANLPEDLTRYDRKCIRAVLNYAIDLGQRIDPVAIRHLKPQSPKKSPKRLLTSEEVATLQARADATSLGNGALIHMISTYGHRGQSLFDLTAQAFTIDPSHHTSSLTLRVKSGDTIAHPILPETSKRVQTLIEASPSGPLFINHLGAQWTLSKIFAAWWMHGPAKSLGTGAGVLGLRRYAITRMLTLGLDAKTVAAITGHQTVSLLLDTYAQTDDQRKQQAIAALSGAL